MRWQFTGLRIEFQTIFGLEEIGISENVFTGSICLIPFEHNFSMKARLL
jgi:hypothetical protein